MQAAGIADILGVEVRAVGGPDTLDEVTRALAREGKRARALYVTPEFDNPTGAVLSRAEREALVAACAEKRIVVLEDNPYGMFRFEGERSAPLFSLDTRGAVIYLGTFSKTLCPALRVGFLVVPERLFGDDAASRALLSRLSAAKSFVTVNTSQIMQAVVGGVLLAEGGTLARIVQPARAFYGKNRDIMLDALSAAFAGADVSWNRPQGGFFLTVRLPFDFGRAETEICAREHDVLVMPMSFFALDRAHDRAVRLAFSNVAPDEIPIGVERFARFVRARR